MRILWYSLGRWFVPSASDFEVIELLPTVTDNDLNALLSEPYVYFFEPTPYRQVNHYDPIDMAERISGLGNLRPQRVVAFVSHPAPTTFETQCAFAAQAGHVLGVTPEIQRVAVTTQARRRSAAAKKSQGNGGEPQQIDPGPEVDWLRALNAAVLASDNTEQVPAHIQLFVARYLNHPHGKPWFSPTQKRLLHRVSTGELGVIAEEIAHDLPVQLVTAQRAIRDLAKDFFQDNTGRRSPELVGRLIAQYAWFLQYNEY